MEDDKFPMALSAVNPELATKLVQTGLHDGDPEDDVIAVGSKNYAAKDLSPSQTSMDVNKAMWFALGMLNGTMFGSGGPGGDLGAFISGDNYIMDGHHRWIATAMAKPDASIKGIRVDFPGKKLVPVLNAATVGLLGITKGKAGSGGFKQFQSKKAMETALTKLIKGGGKYKGVAGDDSPETAQKVIEEFSGEEGDEAVGATVDKMMANLALVPGSKGEEAVMPGAPARIDMPVIDDDYATRNKPAVANVKKALETGEIDVNPDYGELPEEGDEEKKEKSESFQAGKTTDKMVMERWQRLAGLLKG